MVVARRCVRRRGIHCSVRNRSSFNDRVHASAGGDAAATSVAAIASASVRDAPGRVPSSAFQTGDSVDVVEGNDVEAVVASDEAGHAHFIGI